MKNVLRLTLVIFKWSALAASTISPSSTLLAEVYNCDGVFSSRPCDQLSASYADEVDLSPQKKDASAKASKKNQKSMVKEVSATDKSIAVLKSKKSLAVHDLRTKALKAKKSYAIDFDLSSIEEHCNDLKTDLPTCRQAVSVADKDLFSRVQAAKEVETQRNVVANRPTPQADTKVVIVQNNIAQRRPLLVYDFGPLLPPISGQKPGARYAEPIIPEPLPPQIGEQQSQQEEPSVPQGQIVDLIQ